MTEALKKQKDLFAAAEVPKDEVTKELEKLKQEDPQFVELTKQTQSILEERAPVRRADGVHGGYRAGADQDKRALSAARRTAARAQGTAAVILSQRGEVALQEMRQKAMHRLKKYQYLLARAYEYRMLQKSPGDLTLTNLFSEMQALVRVSNGVLDPETYKHLFVLYHDELSARSRSPMPTTRTSARTRYPWSTS